jgi:hypothetical protein
LTSHWLLFGWGRNQIPDVYNNNIWPLTAF